MQAGWLAGRPKGHPTNQTANRPNQPRLAMARLAGRQAGRIGSRQAAGRPTGRPHPQLTHQEHMPTPHRRAGTGTQFDQLLAGQLADQPTAHNVATLRI